MPTSPLAIFALIITGLAVGFIAGIFGGGGGVLLLCVTVLSGTASAAWRGDVSLPLSLTLLAGSSIGAQFGASVTNRLPNRTLRGVFAYLVGAAALAVLWNLVLSVLP